MSKIVIIGGGAAGLLCAAKSAEKGNDVVIIEKMNRCGRKLMITGKGRCNVTNASFELDDLISNVPTNPRFLYSAFSNFMPYDTMALFEELGVALKIERGNRVFPVSDKAVDIVDALVNYAKNSGVKIIQGTAKAFEFNNNKINSVVLEDKSKIECDKVCLCTGGKSYHLTGSTGDGFRMAESLGHTVTPLRGSLVPLVSPDEACAEMQGLSLRNTGVQLRDEKGKTVYQDFGELLFTHFGVSGPTVLSASAHLKPGKSYSLVLDLKPALDEGKLDARFLRDLEAYANRSMENALADLFPHSMIPVLLRRAGIDPALRANSLTRQQRRALLEETKRFVIPISGTRPVEEAIITRGGVSTKEIDPRTMASKLVHGLYFAGELIDCDAYTGGFNLQIAWATAHAAAQVL